MGVIQGARRGLIIALFSFIGWFIGLAAAVKLSSILAAYLQNSTNINVKWLPFLSFILVFVVVILLVQLAGKAIENLFDITLLGWVNRLGGALLYTGMYTLLFSIILFYADKMHLVNSDSLMESRAYSMIGGLAPLVIEGLGNLIPVFKNTFHELEIFFENIGKKINQG